MCAIRPIGIILYVGESIVVTLADFPEHIQDEKYKDCFTVVLQ